MMLILPVSTVGTPLRRALCVWGSVI